MEEILGFGRGLQQFEAEPGNEIFKDAQNLPQFFYSNLLDDARVIKQFKNDPQGNLRVFYYQYLKLCFEFDNPNYQFYIDKIQQFITNPEFYFLFPQGDDPQIFNDKQFKRLLIEFFDYMNQGGITVNNALNKYPIIDIVLVYFFRTFLILAEKTDSFDSYIDRQSLFDLLTSYFSVQASVHQNCMKFVQTDIFSYEQTPTEVYMIYIDYQHSLQPSQQPSQPFSHQLSSQLSGQQTITNTETLHTQSQNINYQSQTNKPVTYMGNSDIYDFVDYTNPKNKPNQVNLGYNKPISTIMEDEPESNTSTPLTSNLPSNITSNITSNIASHITSHIATDNPSTITPLANAPTNTPNVSLYEPTKYNQYNSAITTNKDVPPQQNDLLRPNLENKNIYDQINNDATFKINNMINNQSYASKYDTYSSQSKNKIKNNEIYAMQNNYYFPEFNNLSKTVTTNYYTQSTNSKNNLYSNNLLQSSIAKQYEYNKSYNSKANITVDYKAQTKHNRSLNISQQMTNSFTLEKIIEPHRTNIKAMKVRARANRKPIGYII